MAFALIGGGYYLYKSYAATDPTSWRTDIYTIYPGKAEITCLDAADGVYGGIAWNCLQKDISAGYYYVGYYSVQNKKFTPTTTNLKQAFSGAIRDYGQAKGPYKCINMDNYFFGQGPLLTGYGPVYYGYVFVYYNGWAMKRASYSSITRNCSTDGNWIAVKDLSIMIYLANQ